MNTTPITLTHNQVIRVRGFRPSLSRIRVRTQEGVIAEFGPQSCNEHGLLAWTLQITAALDADNAARDAQMNAIRAEVQAAPEIAHGDEVVIEGRHYTVRVHNQHVYDPVEFTPNTQPL